MKLSKKWHMVDLILKAEKTVETFVSLCQSSQIKLCTFFTSHRIKINYCSLYFLQIIWKHEQKKSLIYTAGSSIYVKK